MEPAVHLSADTSKPHPARVYDWLLGGENNYPVDREIGEVLPTETRGNAVRNRAFMRRAVDWLAKKGVDQFLDIGSGIPTEPNLHQIAQAIVPAARIVYADSDPSVLPHAQALLTSTPQGSTDFLHADVRQPVVLLERAGENLDFERPVALSLLALLHFLPDDEDPYGVVSTLVKALAPGSFLILSHGTTDQHPEWKGKIEAAYERGAIPLRLRTRREVEPFFEGLELVAPGLVYATEWYQEGPAPTPERSGLHVGVARIP
ncbi:SAM-dependent methyltransferase [Streptomyces apricus]|uniref:SAM-dependent methyltransferase n=1 Tax=Streptomyces apricus TaxID=1828112 RepID=A0A5B0BAW9_9ACTN|nr:SAM-dependent methyltransferase [Streptomyces apricus]KAA0939403.1 SAM-dependent methyltransferase [Streptomyces apricus]